MKLVHAAIPEAPTSLPAVALRTHRLTLAKRRWRGVADDGMEFGFALNQPLRHGEAFFVTPGVRYVIVQDTEAVVEIPLDVTPAAAAGIGWAIGNLHLELAGEPDRLLAVDEPAVRRLLERLQVPYRTANAIFRPGRFVRGAQTSHELGTSHRH